MAEGGGTGRGGGEERGRWGIYRAIVARVIQFFLHGRGKRGEGEEDESSYIIRRFCSNDSEKLAVWLWLGSSSKTDDDVSGGSIVGIEKRVGSIKRGVGGRRREEAVARG